jgi:hypothetical protein
MNQLNALSNRVEYYVSRVEHEPTVSYFRGLSHPQVKPLLSDEHFSADGTLIEAWASQKSFRPKDGSGGDDGANFHGQKRKNDRQWHRRAPRLRDHAQGQEQGRWPAHHGR